MVRQAMCVRSHTSPLHHARFPGKVTPAHVTLHAVRRCHRGLSKEGRRLAVHHMPCIVLAEESEELLPDVLAVQCRPPLGDGAVSNSRLHGGVRNVREEVRARIELAQGFIFLGHQQKRGQPSQNGIIILMSSRYLEDYFNMALDAR